jgi:hypothetical protein
MSSGTSGNGVQLNVGATAWTTFSDETSKKNITQLSLSAEDMEKFFKLQVITFNYNNEVVQQKNNNNTPSKQINKDGKVNLNYNNTPDENPYPPKKHVGLIAQEVQHILPEAVYPWIDNNDKDNKKLGIAYSELTPLLVKVCQDLKKENDDLKSRIETLEKEKNTYLQRTTTLEQKTQEQDNKIIQLLERMALLEILINNA